MDMREYAARVRPQIAARIGAVLAARKPSLASVSTESAALLDRLANYTLGGKMLRGTLVCLSYELCGAEQACFADAWPDSILDVAAAMELLQSGLLVHDDIMDGDTMRRGHATMHCAFAIEAARGQADQEPRVAALGEALGICVGDIAYFIAMELLAAHSAELSMLCAQELVKVCLAQMQDVRWGYSRDCMPSPDEIIAMYRHKTARYSFSLPLMAGALVARGAPAQTAAPAGMGMGPGMATNMAALLESLAEYGEHVGIIFQIKDDELGLFSDTAHLGKPVGSDIREGKKTLYRALLAHVASPEDVRRMNALFGAADLSEQDLFDIRALYKKYTIQTQIDAIVEAEVHKAKSAIAASAGAHKKSALWDELIGYLRDRTQ